MLCTIPLSTELQHADSKNEMFADAFRDSHLRAGQPDINGEQSRPGAGGGGGGY